MYRNSAFVVETNHAHATPVIMPYFVRDMTPRIFVIGGAREQFGELFFSLVSFVQIAITELVKAIGCELTPFKCTHHSSNTI